MSKNRTIPGTLAIISLVIALVACNFNLGGTVTPPSATPTEVSSPTATQLPPTETPTPTPTNEPASETPNPLPPTVTLAPTATSGPVTATTPVASPIPPTVTAQPTQVVVTTPQPVQPAARARFEGTFLYGTLVLRTTTNGHMIIPKTVTLRNAPCKVGHNSVTFEPPPAFDIIDAKFTINTEDLFTGDTVVITGQFFSPTSVQGTIKVNLKGNGKSCSFGPLSWRGTMTEQQFVIQFIDS
jgi:hypothetical protein